VAAGVQEAVATAVVVAVMAANAVAVVATAPAVPADLGVEMVAAGSTADLRLPSQRRFRAPFVLSKAVAALWQHRLVPHKQRDQGLCAHLSAPMAMNRGIKNRAFWQNVRRIEVFTRAKYTRRPTL